MQLNKLVPQLFSKKNKIESKVIGMVRRHNFIPIDESHSNDIFIVGYPKSGNTWMQSLIAGVLYGIDTEYLPDRLAQEIVPDLHAKRLYKRFFDITFFKTHDLPQKKFKRVIYLARDGRDVMVSYYHMHTIQGVNVTFEDMVLFGKKLFPSKWHIHVEKWLSTSLSSNFMVLRYEDLIEKPISELKRVCKFANLDRPDDLLKKVVDGCSFKKMQQKEVKFGFDNQKWKGDGKSKRFFRKGKVGSYKDEFPMELLTKFEKESENALRSLNYV